MSWTLVTCLMYHREDMAGYLVSVVESPDRSLWFLLVLFWCRMFFVLVHAAGAKAFRNLTVSVLAVMMLVIFAAIRPLMPGSFMGAALFLAHFPYFALGVFMWQYRAKLSGFLSDIPAILAMIALFAVIAPCWYLVSPNPFVAKHGRLLFAVVKRVSPVPGIFLTLSLTKILARPAFSHIIKFLGFTGTMTLGIYALHSHFLGYFPPVIIPLSASIILTLLTEKIPFIRTLLLGK